MPREVWRGAGWMCGSGERCGGQLAAGDSTIGGISQQALWLAIAYVEGVKIKVCVHVVLIVSTCSTDIDIYSRPTSSCIVCYHVKKLNTHPLTYTI